MTDADPLVAIQNAALERALLDEADSSAHVLLAGALERARTGEDDVADAERPASGELSAGEEPAYSVDADRVAGSLLTATLTATLAVRHAVRHSFPAAPQSPTVETLTTDATGDRRQALLLEGATLAVERVDASTAEAAHLAGVDVSTLEREIARQS